MMKDALIEEELTHSIIGAFYRVYTYVLHPAAQRQLYNYLRSTNLEVGLLLHFGREAEFYRLFCRNTHHSAHADRPGLRG